MSDEIMIDDNEKLEQIYYSACREFPNMKGLRAVAEAAIAADRAARGEPVGWQFFHEGRWVNGMETNNHRANTEAAGIPVRDVFAIPSAAPVVPEGWKLVPTALTAENGAKAALMGEFSMRQVYQCPCFPEGGTSTCMVCKGAGWMTLQMPVDWSTIKAIWAAGIAHFAAAPAPSQDNGGAA